MRRDKKQFTGIKKLNAIKIYITYKRRNLNMSLKLIPIQGTFSMTLS